MTAEESKTARLGWALPKNLSVKGRAVLSLAMHMADDTGVIDARQLRAVSGVSAPTVRRHLAELEFHRLLRRYEEPDGTPKIRIAYSRVFKEAWPTCEHCHRPVLVGTGYAHKYCAVCMATIVRHDRRWREHAFEAWAAAAPSDSEAKIVYRIHMQTNQPIFTKRSDVDLTREGIVNWMLSIGLLREPSWQTRARAFKEGEEGE